MKIRDILQAIIDEKQDEVEIVVKCKNCVHSSEMVKDHKWYLLCGIRTGDNAVVPNDFCSKAERRQDEQTN